VIPLIIRGSIINKSFKIPYGDRDGKLIHISQVERGLKCNCKCPDCEKPLVARKGQKTKHHFAHYPGANCSAETVLHQLGKRLLYNRISSAIINHQSVPICWQCEYCPEEHKGNLVKKASTLEIEKDFGTCRPDITLLQEDKHPVVFIEIVVSHAPDENVLNYVTENDITLVEFHLKSAEDLEVIVESSTLHPTIVHLCLRPKCKVCGHPLHPKVLHIFDGDCWKCNASMKIAVLDVEFNLEGPENFSKEEIDIARRHGAILKINYSRDSQEAYLSNTCGHCGVLTGRHYLHHFIDLMKPGNGHKTGNICMTCNENVNRQHNNQVESSEDLLDGI